MSIYESWEDIGLDEDQKANGEVLRYVSSVQYPAAVEAVGAVTIGSIPSHCTPDYAGDETEYAKAPFLRLGVSTREYGFDPVCVVLSEQGVERLWTQLTEWLAIEKVGPA